MPENHKAASRFQVFQRETEETDRTNHAHTYAHTYAHIRTLRPQHLQRYNFTGSNYCGPRRLLFSFYRNLKSHTLSYVAHRSRRNRECTHIELKCARTDVTTTQQCNDERAFMFFNVSPADNNDTVFLSNAESVFTHRIEILY